MSHITVVRMTDFGRVFYVEVSPEKKAFVDFENFLQMNFIRDKDLVLEDACHPITPGNIRFISATDEIADTLEKFFLERPQQYHYVRRNESDKWFVGNPDTHLLPW